MPATNFEPSDNRILVICNDADYFLRHRLSVVSHLSSVGARVMVIAGGNPIPAERINGWEYVRVRIERFKFDPISDVALMVRTVRAIWDLKPDAIHLITLKPMIFSGTAAIASRLFLGYPKRVLITLPGLGRMMSRTKAPGERRYPVGKALTLFMSRMLARFDCVRFTFETKHDFDFWAKCGIANNNNSTVIDGAGVDPTLFYPSSALNGATRKVIFASRTLKSKGLNAFLQMAQQLSDRIDVEFLVAGIADDGDPDAISSDYLAKLSEIRFLGHVADMAPLLRDCDIVCLPTRYGEGIPRILIEAAATGLASIVSSHPGCLEVVEDGVTGKVLHASTDAEMGREMATAVIKYLDSPDILRMHKENAYRHFLSREFKQQSIDTRFAELLGVGSKPL
jgi:glycosyltransferase involved in cell wall biosynthesis